MRVNEKQTLHLTKRSDDVWIPAGRKTSPNEHRGVREKEGIKNADVKVEADASAAGTRRQL